MNKDKIKVEYVPIGILRVAENNPKAHSDEEAKHLEESVNKFDLASPIICNKAQGRENIIIDGEFRLETAKKLGMETVPVVYLDIPDIEKETELRLRFHKNTGHFNLELLAEFDKDLLKDVGFDSEEMDDIFPAEEKPEEFDIEKELGKLGIDTIEIQKGDVWDLDGSRLCCGDSTIESDMMNLMGDEKADMVMTDPPYVLDYLRGKKKDGVPTEGFGLKRNRKYLETDEIPDDFTEKWMLNISKVQKEDFHIIVYECWKNVRLIWGEMEKHWKVRNMLIWHLSNRTQGFSAKYRFFSKYDFALVGSSKEDSKIDMTPEEDPLLQEEYETALYATSGKPHWEGYEAGKKICPSDFIEYKASDEKSSGQGIIFGVKPVEILVPYIKVLTRRGDLVIEPFGGSGSTLIACTKLQRRCYLMEKSPTYAEVIRKRWEKLTGKKAVKIKSHGKPTGQDSGTNS
jgi:DNA modification methylase